ncbi:MMPL family transporter [Mycobacterium uberis]|uniref:MMPL family transporter n=1 Tax=Mycobacterium uberis TaxID=2162698 RepID=UPI000E302ECE
MFRTCNTSWVDLITVTAEQSNDDKAVSAQLLLVGNRGESLASESLEAVRKVVAETQALSWEQDLCQRASSLIMDMRHSDEK